MTISMDSASKKLKQYSVSTYMDAPDDAVRIDVNFSSLADGTSHVEEVHLESVKRQIQIKTTNFDYQKVGP